MPATFVPRLLHARNGQWFWGDTCLGLDTLMPLHVLALGKASSSFWGAVRNVLKPQVRGGCLVLPRGVVHPPEDLLTLVAGDHPLPGAGSLRAGRFLRDYLIREVRPGDGLLLLLSGGGSALMLDPDPELPLAALLEAHALLYRSGAPIDGVNALRRRLCRLKGGGLLCLLPEGVPVCTLGLSDVPSAAPWDLASGPAVRDPLSGEERRRILDRWDPESRIDPCVRRRILAHDPRDEVAEGRGRWCLAGDNRLALDAMEAWVQVFQPDLTVVRPEWPDQGEARVLGRHYARCCLAQADRGPRLLLAGGECTVTVSGDGRGGRNQELMLGFLEGLRTESWKGWAFSLGTDGVDGTSDAAGAWVDAGTVAEANRRCLDPRAYLERNDSHAFWEALGQGHLHTGPTGTNVMDIRAFLVP